MRIVEAGINSDTAVQSFNKFVKARWNTYTQLEKCLDESKGKKKPAQLTSEEMFDQFNNCWEKYKQKRQINFKEFKDEFEN